MSSPSLPILLRYVTEESSVEEAQCIEQWCMERPEHRAVLDAFWEDSANASSLISIDVGRAMARLRERLDSAEPDRLHRGNRSTRFIVAGVCAGGIVLAMMLGSSRVLDRFQGQNTHRSTASAGFTYTTENGRRGTVTLPDGTVVMLNVASQLHVPSGFTHGHRNVRLRGEAIFQVVHRAGAPLTVSAGPSTTRVLGTNFTVRYYETDTAATVAVRDGKVAVQSVVLSAGQQISVTPHALSNVSTSDGAQFSFADGILTIEEMPLTKAIEALNRWYDVDILLGHPGLADRRIGGQFEQGKSEYLVQLLRLTFGVRVVQDGRTLTLYPGQ